MPSTSRSQQRLFGMVRAHQAGKLKNATGKIKDMAANISPSDASDFAETKHKGLPEKKAVLSALGGALGLFTAPNGYRTEGAGRGALKGFGTELGAIGGGLTGLAAGQVLMPNASPEAQLLAAAGGAGLGALTGLGVATHAMGRPRWQDYLNRRAVYLSDHGYANKAPREKESTCEDLGKAAAGPAPGMPGAMPGGGGGGGIMFAGRQATKLGPMQAGSNPATQLDGQAPAGPGAGGAATAENVMAQLPQAQQAAGMVPTMPANQLPSAQAPQQPPQQQPPQQPMPQQGFVPNQQGQVVYPPGQGPVTGQVPKLATWWSKAKAAFMLNVANKPMNHSELGDGDYNDLSVVGATEGPDAWKSVLTAGRRNKLADYSQLYTIAGDDAFLKSFIDKCAAENYLPTEIQKAASECSLVSDEMASKLKPLCKSAAIPFGSFFRGAEGAAAGAGKFTPRVLGATFTTAGEGAAGAAGSAGRSLVPAGGMGGAGATSGMGGAGASAARSFLPKAMSPMGEVGKQLATRGLAGGAGYLGGGAIDMGTKAVTGQDPGIRNYAGAAGLVGTRGVAGYGMGGMLDYPISQMTGGFDPHLRDAGAVAGGMSNFAGPMSKILPGGMGQAAGAVENVARGAMDPKNVQRGFALAGGGPEYAGNAATRLGQRAATNIERVGIGTAAATAGTGIRDVTRDRTIQGVKQQMQDPQQLAQFAGELAEQHPDVAQQAISQIAQEHPQLLSQMAESHPELGVKTLFSQLDDPAKAPQAKQMLTTAFDQIEQRLQSQVQAGDSSAGMMLKQLQMAKGPLVQQLSKPGGMGGAAAGGAAGAAGAGGPMQAMAGGAAGIWQWFQGLPAPTQFMLGSALVLALGGLFTERPGMAAAGLGLGAAAAMLPQDYYGLGMMAGGQQPSQAPSAGPLGAQAPQAQAQPQPQSGLGFHPHQAMPTAA